MTTVEKETLPEEPSSKVRVLSVVLKGFCDNVFMGRGFHRLAFLVGLVVIRILTHCFRFPYCPTIYMNSTISLNFNTYTLCHFTRAL